MYHSHILVFPNSPPFDRPEFRWASFVGEFVAPLMNGRTNLFWCTYYGDRAHFRILIDDYESLQLQLEPLRDSLGLVDTGEQKNQTLIDDLGHSRFLSQNSKSDSPKRAALVLKYLNSIALLLIDNVQKRQDGYWELETSTDNENPLGNNFESLAHLLANMTGFQFDVLLGHQTVWQHLVIHKSLRCHL